MNRRRATPHCRHRFTALTDLLVSPGSGGSSIYNWGFEVLGGCKHEAFRQRIVQLAELRGDEAVLDAGCSTGLATLRIAEQLPGCRVCGIDLSPKMIAVARNDTAARVLRPGGHFVPRLLEPLAANRAKRGVRENLGKLKVLLEIGRVTLQDGRTVTL